MEKTLSFNPMVWSPLSPQDSVLGPLSDLPHCFPSWGPFSTVGSPAVAGTLGAHVLQGPGTCNVINKTSSDGSCLESP